MSYSKAKKEVRSIIKKLKKEAQQDGTYYRPLNFGDQLLEKESTDEKIKAYLAKVRKEGATNEDIRFYWNLHELERRIIVVEDDIYKTAVALNYLEDGLSWEEAAKKVKKNVPIYGKPDEDPSLKSDDIPLPEELRDRVNIFINKWSQINSNKLKKEIKKFSSFNAFIRNKIRDGKL